jgi:hypothetical protein
MKNKRTAKSLKPRDHLLDRPAAQNASTLLLLFFLIGLILPVVSGASLAIHYIGFPNNPAPVVPYILLPLGLLSAVVGQRLCADRCEGGVMELLHERFTYASLAYLGWAVKYTLRGRPIERSPAGLFTVLSGILLVSRLLVKCRGYFPAVVRKQH